jgi:Ca2+-binding RTX toxin-like protein
MSSTLTAGDIAIIGFSSDDNTSTNPGAASNPTNETQFSFVLLKSISQGEEIRFTDSPWDETQTQKLRTTEGHIIWTASSSLSAGTVIHISFNTTVGSTDVNKPIASQGTAVQSGATHFQLRSGNNGDQIFAYQGTATSPTFIYGLNESGTPGAWITTPGTATSGQTSYQPTGLTNFVLLDQTFNNGTTQNTVSARYTGSTSGSKDDLLALINNKTNWTSSSSRVTLSTVVPASFTVAADQIPPTANIVDVTPDPRNTNAGVVTVDFDEDVSGVDITDFTLTRDGAAVTLSGVSVTQVSATQYTLNLSGVTTTDGSYNLVLNANSSIKDLANNVITTNASDTWTVDTTLPTADIVDISPDPRNAAVGVVTVNFTEDVSGVDITDFALTRDGVSVPLSGSVTQVNAKQYTLDLSSVTATAGAYVLTLNTSNIKDFANNPLAASVNDSWSFVTAPTADIIDVTPDPRNTAVGVVTVDFSQEVSNVDITDFVLTRNGVGVPLTGITVTKSVADPTQYTLNLTNVTNTDGTYILTVNPSDIKDAANNLLAGSVSDTWVVDKTAPTANIVDVTPDPRNTAVGVVTVDFNENVSGVDITDFTLTRDGAAVALSGVSVTQVSATQYTLNLSSVTTTSGNYILSLNAATSGITDLTNNAFAVSATDTWVTDATAPTVDIVDITPDPRNTAVGAVTLNFSENVTGVDIADFTLTRDGANVPLSGISVIKNNDKQYTLNLTNFSATSGNYELKLNAAGSGIQDAVGNAITVDGSDSWVTDATVPTADIIDVTPDPRNNAVGVVTVDFTEDVTGVNITDFTLTRNGTNVNIASVPFAQVNAKQYTLDLTGVSATSGNYVLSLNAANSGIKDATNNLFATSVTDSWVTDTTGLSADIVDVTPDPRNSAVGVVNINFNTSVTGVDIADFALTLDSNPVNIGSLSVSGSNNQYTLDLSTVTTTSGTYALTLNAANSGIQDSLNNTLSTNSTDTWVFDNTAPTFSSFNPADDATNVPVTNNLSVTFNEAIQKGAGNVTIKKVSDDSVVQTIDVTTAAATVSGSTLTINPPANLDITTEYYVEMVSGAIKDLAGNDFAGIANNSDWTFTTAATVVSPGGGSTGGGSTGGGSTGGGSTGGGSTGGGSTGGGSTGGGSTGGGSTGGTTDTPDSTDSGSDNPPSSVPSNPSTGTPTPTVHAGFQPNVTIDTVFGGDTDDSLLGTADANQLIGLGGQDVITGLDGNDNLFGNGGDDVMFGNQGADYMDGGKGQDILFAGKDDDAVKGGEGDDVLMGDIGNDRLAGDSGNDILLGNLGEDCLDGGEGDDLLFGGRGNDTLIGGLANDILKGDFGDDLLIGGAGGDRFDFRPADGINIITDFTDGQDIIGLQAGLTFEQLTISQVGNDTQITAGGLSITLQAVGSSTIGSADFALV